MAVTLNPKVSGTSATPDDASVTTVKLANKPMMGLNNLLDENDRVFSRNSTATGLSGQKYSLHAPRRENGKLGKGYLIEESSTNSLLYSQQFDNAAWSIVFTPVITPNTTIAPDGEQTAYTILDDNNVNEEYIYQQAVCANSEVWTSSIYVKKDAITTRFSELQLVFLGGTTPITYGVQVNTSTGEIIARGSVGSISIKEKNGYWRISVSGVNNATNNTIVRIQFIPSASTIWNSWEPTATGSTIIWGAQLEKKPQMTSYIPTTAAAVTRVADSLKYSLQNELPTEFFACGWIKPTFVSGTNKTPNYYHILNLSVDVNNRNTVYISPVGDSINYFKNVAGAGSNISYPISFSANQPIFYAIANLTTAHGSLPAGMHLWVGVNGSTLQHVSNTNTTYFTGVNSIYVGNYSSPSHEVNAVVDFPIVSSTVPTSQEQVESIYRASDLGGTRNILPSTSVAARIRQSVAQAILNATWTSLTFDTMQWDSHGMYSSGTNTRLTCTVPGLYRISGNLSFAANATGDRSAVLMLNGATSMAEALQKSSSSGDKLSISCEYYLSVGDYVELRAWQNSTVSLNTAVSSMIPYLSIIRIS